MLGYYFLPIKGTRQAENRENFLQFFGDGYFRAGMIFQHSDSLQDIRKVKSLALKGHHIGSKNASWLYAAPVRGFISVKNLSGRSRKEQFILVLDEVDKDELEKEHQKIVTKINPLFIRGD